MVRQVLVVLAMCEITKMAAQRLRLHGTTDDGGPSQLIAPVAWSLACCLRLTHLGNVLSGGAKVKGEQRVDRITKGSADAQRLAARDRVGAAVELCREETLEVGVLLRQPLVLLLERAAVVLLPLPRDGGLREEA